MAEGKKHRLAYIDWMRGFACLVMFQTHCYDSWLSPAARETTFFKMSQLGGTLPAPLFLILAGISFAFVTDGIRKRGATPGEVARKTILRGAEILGFGLLFRFQEYMLGGHGVPWTDLLRVDILNTIGVSMMLMGITCWTVGAISGGGAGAAALRLKNSIFAAACALAISLVSPLIWTTWRPRWLPWFLESYINGVHIFDKPQPWLFPIFPWTAFAFAGLAVGFILVSDWARAHESRTILALGAIGAAIGGIGWWLDAQHYQLYVESDFWHTSPNFFLIRIGILLLIMLGAFAWCRWGTGQRGFSPLIEMGQASLLVYWVHIEFVYGALKLFKSRSQTIGWASAGLALIFVSMVLLAVIRNRTRGRGGDIFEWFRRTPRPTEA